jgi:hypothetical protein
VTIQAQVLALITDLKKKFGASVMLITHDLGVVAETADNVLVMYAGKAVEYADVDPPTIGVSPSSFSHTIPRGQNPTPNPDQFDLSNTGGGTLAYTITEDPPCTWLSVSPDSGLVPEGQSDTISINYDTTGLAMGVHSCSLRVDAPGATNTPQTVSVEITVNPPDFAPVDFDQDTDVDMDDYAELQRCFTGAGMPIVDPTCIPMDVSGDESIDSQDLGKFLACLSGAGLEADPLCAD